MADQRVASLFPTGNLGRLASAAKAILHPFDPAEAIRISEAATRSGKSERTIRNWCLDHQIGRRIAGQWAVSAVALDMFLEGDVDCLQAYLAGDRTSEQVTSYFKARSIPLATMAATASFSASRS